MSKLILPLLIIFILSGCAMTVNVSGDNIMIEHEAHKSVPAFNKAKEVCEAKGMDVKLERTACPHFCVSTFECLPKKN